MAGFKDFDHVVVGGSAGLYEALAYKRQYPDRTVAIIDAGEINRQPSLNTRFNEAIIAENASELQKHFGKEVADSIAQQMTAALAQIAEFQKEGNGVYEQLKAMEEAGQGVTFFENRRLLNFSDPRKKRGKEIPAVLQIINGNINTHSFHIAVGTDARKLIRGLDAVTYEEGGVVRTVNDAVIGRSISPVGTVGAAFGDDDAVLRIALANAVAEHHTGKPAALAAWAKLSDRLPYIPRELRGDPEGLKEYREWFEKTPPKEHGDMLVNWRKRSSLTTFDTKYRLGGWAKAHWDSPRMRHYRANITESDWWNSPGAKRWRQRASDWVDGNRKLGAQHRKLRATQRAQFGSDFRRLRRATKRTMIKIRSRTLSENIGVAGQHISALNGRLLESGKQALAHLPKGNRLREFTAAVRELATSINALADSKRAEAAARQAEAESRLVEARAIETGATAQLALAEQVRRYMDHVDSRRPATVRDPLAGQTVGTAPA